MWCAVPKKAQRADRGHLQLPLEASFSSGAGALESGLAVHSSATQLQETEAPLCGTSEASHTPYFSLLVASAGLCMAPSWPPESGLLSGGRKREVGRRALFIVMNVMDVAAPRGTGHQGKDSSVC